MDTGSIVTLIGSVSVLLAALIGASALLITHRRDTASKADAERRAALVAFYAAVCNIALFFEVWASLQSRLPRPLAQLQIAIRTLGHHGRLIDRGFRVVERFWAASGRARTVASPDELAKIHAIEAVIADWRFGDPTPKNWPSAIHDVQLLLERPSDTSSRTLRAVSNRASPTGIAQR